MEKIFAGHELLPNLAGDASCITRVLRIAAESHQAAK
jgi:hypothetical protein